MTNPLSTKKKSTKSQELRRNGTSYRWLTASRWNRATRHAAMPRQLSNTTKRSTGSLSPAVFPRRVRHGQGSDAIPAFGFHHAQDHHRMITVGIHDPLELALDMRWQVGQHGRGGRALHERFAVDRSADRMRGEEKPLGDFLLPVAHDVQDGNTAFSQTREDIALPADRRHDERRLE